MDFTIYHLYNRLAARGQVDALACNDCGSDLQLQADDVNGELEPILVCYYCPVTIHPGSNLYDTLCEKVYEYYPDLELED